MSKYLFHQLNFSQHKQQAIYDHFYKPKKVIFDSLSGETYFISKQGENKFIKESKKIQRKK
jgi:hypothetical protein